MTPFKTWYLLIILTAIIGVTVMIHYLIFLVILIIGILAWRAAKYLWRKQ